MKAVRIYGRTSKQCINYEKLSILFGKITFRDQKQAIKDSLGIQHEGGMWTYLEIPEDISGSKCNFFAFFCESK